MDRPFGQADREWRGEDVEKLTEMVAAGVKDWGIAQALGRSEGAIVHKRRRLGLSKRAPQSRKRQLKPASHAHADGLHLPRGPIKPPGALPHDAERDAFRALILERAPGDMEAIMLDAIHRANEAAA